MSSFAAASVAQLATAARRCRSRTPDEPTARERLASLAKPPGSLGVLEDWAITLCQLQNTLQPVAEPQSVLIFCADHGVKKADGALSPFPASVSAAVFRALAAGISATATLAHSQNAHLTVVDVGIDGDVSRVGSGQPWITVRHTKAARGSADLRIGPALDEGALERALQAGTDCVADEVATRGAKVVAIGEVGIGNTTVAAALLCALTGADAAACCGRGTGLDDAGLEVLSVETLEVASVEELACTHYARAPGEAWRVLRVWCAVAASRRAGRGRR